MNPTSAKPSERQFRHGGIYEEIPFGVWLCSADGGLQYASSSFLELLGLSMEEAGAFGWTSCVATEDLDSVERWKQCVEQGTDWDDEHRIQDQQGEMRTLLARGHAVRNDHGQVEHWIGVHLDITKRKLAEQQVEDERNFAKAIIATTPDPLIVLDEEHRVLTANRAFYQQFETQKAETEGTRLHELGNGQWNIPALHRLLEEVLQENESFDEYEVEHDFPDIGRKVMLVSGRRVQQQVNQTETILLAIRDVTEARQQEHRLRIAQCTQAVEQERQRIARRLHDHLQQLLIGARMHVANVHDNEANESNKALLEKVQDVLKDAVKASRDLAVELTPPALYESGLAGAMEWMVSWMKEHYRFDLKLDIKQGILLQDKNVRLLLFDAIRELLVNVVKHAQVDSARVQIGEKENRLQVVVQDQGVGYDPNQVESSDDLATGFGLSSIRRRVESLGGSFQIDSRLGQGTTTTIEVPMWPE